MEGWVWNSCKYISQWTRLMTAWNGMMNDVEEPFPQFLYKDKWVRNNNVIWNKKNNYNNNVQDLSSKF